jgi:hypothetical protein
MANLYRAHNPYPQRGESDVLSAWGVTYPWREDWPAKMPIHTPDKILVKDVTQWQEYVKAPNTKFSENFPT